MTKLELELGERQIRNGGQIRKGGQIRNGGHRAQSGASWGNQEPSRVINSNQEQSRVIKSTPRACSLIGLAIKSNQEHSADLLLDWLEIEPRALRSAFVSAERDE